MRRPFFIHTQISWIDFNPASFQATIIHLFFLKLILILKLTCIFISCRFLAVIGNHAFQKSKSELLKNDPVLSSDEDNHRGILSIFESIENAQQNFRYDKRLTGSSSMDAAIQEVLFIPSLNKRPWRILHH